jgi:DNA-binding MarR family transcriptional regulator
MLTRMVDHAHLFSEMIRFETELWNAVDRRLRARHDLPLTWFEPMQVIHRRGTCRVNDIAEELSITVGGTSKLVDRIENAGHCRRIPNPADRRSSLIKLTASGTKLLARATVSFETELDRRFGLVSSRALSQLGSTLGRLRAAGHELDKIAEQE